MFQKLHAILASAIPSDPPPAAHFVWAFLVGATAAWYATLWPVTKILGLALAADFITGAVAADRKDKWDWAQGWKGIKSKIAVGIVGVMLQKVGELAGPNAEPICGGLLASLCLNEGRSILRNLRRNGYALDTTFDAILTRVKSANDARLGVDDGKPKKTQEK